MRGSLFISVLVVAMPAIASAQSIKRGDYVRVSSERFSRLTGKISVLTADTIVVDTARIALSSVTRLQVRRRSSKAGQGLHIGALVGGGLGALFFLAGEDRSCSGICVGLRDFAPYTTAAGIFLGSLVGTIVGALQTSESWYHVPLKGVNASVLPQHDGRFALVLSVRF